MGDGNCWKNAPAPGQKVFMLAMTDYFSKWIEAEAFRQVPSKEVISFIKINVLCKFGILSEIVCDNGSQFISDKIEAFFRKYNINLVKSTTRYPQVNGQAESSNKIIINSLKKRLSLHKGKWADELPWVLYGLSTYDANKHELKYDIYTIDELREVAKIRMAIYQQKAARSYNKNVHVRIFQVGDMVLRKVFQNTMDMLAGKFADKWERHLILAVVGRGAYQLSTLDGAQIPGNWNALHLKLYHM
ncbi:uncharacterized protein LOC141680314 [Apium graveolens]|uniref:uncharacterized protein LOC141680314 n=1 Tax=Apium graveolens TaxID=4045 RepID=UPI003D7AAAA7